MNAEKTHSEPAKPGGRSPLLFIFLTVFIDLLGFGIVLPLLPVYSKAYGANEIELALLFSCFSGMQFLFAPLWGRISDRIGRRPVLIGGLVGTAGSYVLFGFSHSMTMLFVSRSLAGFFGANISTAQAYIADVTTPANRAKGMGLIGAAFGLGFTFGPLLGGELTAISTGAPGFLAAALSITAAVFGYLKLPEPDRAKRTHSRLFGTRELRHAFSDGRIGILLVLSYLFIFSFSCFESMFTRFGIAQFPDIFHLPQAIDKATIDDIMRAAPIAGRYLCGIGILSAIIQGGLIRRLVPRFGETTLAIAGPFLLGISFFVVGMATSWTIVIVGCAIMPFGFGLNNPALNGLISRATPEDQQGAYLGMNQSFASLARMTGPPVAGAFFLRYGPHTPFVFASAVLFACALLALYYRSRYGSTFARTDEVRAAEA